MKIINPILLISSLLFFGIGCGNDDDNNNAVNTLPVLPVTTCDSISLTFNETGGLVIIEMENVPDLNDIGGWEYRTTNLKQQDGTNFPSTFSGSGYLFYNGEQSFQDGGNSTIEYKINIQTPGVYRFVYASAIGIIADNAPATEHNDAFVRFPDADAFYGYRENDNSIAIPRDQNQSAANPNDTILEAAYPGASYKFPNGSNAKNVGFFKVYMNQLDDWWYEGATSDNNPHNIYARFDNSGTYTLQIAGRSTGFCIDRAVLWIEDGDLADLGTRNKRKAAFEGLLSTESNCP